MLPVMPVPIIQPVRRPTVKTVRKSPLKSSLAPNRNKSINERNDRLSENEIRVIQRIWRSLDMTLEEDTKQQLDHDFLIYQTVPSLTVLEVQGGQKSMSLKSSALREFETRLQNNIFAYFKSHYRHMDLPPGIKKHQGTPEDFLFELHLPAILKLLSVLIWNIEEVEATIQEARNISARIWRFNAWHYNLIGEGLISTILEMLGRDGFSQDNEFTWITFYNKVANQVYAQSQNLSQNHYV